MANNCYDTRLSTYSGTSQEQRTLQALLAKYAKVDERTTAQLILFAKNYGAYLNYYDATNHITGSWQDFMARDVSVTIAAIADLKIKDLTPFINDVKHKVQDAANNEEAKKYFKTLFDLVFTLASQLDGSLRRLPEDVSFTNFLSVAIASNLAIPLATINRYYTDFKSALLPLIDEGSDYESPEMPVTPVVLSGNFDITKLSDAWIVASIAAPPITLKGFDVKDDINHVLTHNLFTGPLQLFINGIINIVSKTPSYLEETLQKYPSHEPHYALYLAFLRLFRFAQEHLNNFTQNHLDFYYKDVLQLKNRNAEPGYVHLVFELQKNIEQYLLKKDTLFKAGKDAVNNDVCYALTDNVILQKTSVQSLQSLYLAKGSGIGTLFAAPVTNSDDGIGGKLTSADSSWLAFGNLNKIPTATIGFVIASNVLFINEGVRTVSFTFQCESILNISANELAGVFSIRFTGKKDWYTANTYEATVDGSVFTIKVKLTGDAPSIIPYSQKIHGGNFNTILPIAEATLIDYTAYQKLKNIRISNITIAVSATVKDLSLQNKDGKISASKPFKPFGDFPERNAFFIIGSKEVFQKQLASLNVTFNWQPVDTSLAHALADAAPSFDFNIREFAGTSFLELSAMESGLSTASNTSTSLKANATMTQAAAVTPSDIQNIVSSPTLSNTSISIAASRAQASPAPAALTALTAGEWSTTLDSSDDLLNDSVSVQGASINNIPLADANFSPNEEYTIHAVSGYAKLELYTDAYSLASYLDNLQKAMEQTSVSVVYDPPNSEHIKSYTVNPPKLSLPAPQLVANSVSIDYSATAVIDFNDLSSFDKRTSFFYHTEPFGWREMHPSITDDAITLLPVFNLDNGELNDTGGELWIGLKDAFPDETITILFQVSDGSANPLKRVTEVSWYYLASNNWFLLDKLAIVDQTNNLTRSGIVTVSLPKDINTSNTRANAGLMWIKGKVDHDTDAVCKLIAVRSNAAKATFVQDLSKGIEYTTPLPANTISKPATPIAAIKKTEQPYTSFGGRLHETNGQFYIRVSERLRHKHRAVARWDYERLVLDYFSQIHKAKCIDHTGFVVNSITKEQKYSEVLPGHVMIITIPDLKKVLAANQLRPYTSVGLIEEIQQYLEKLSSPFVKLHVANPQFEEVQFDFEVNFLPNHDITYYTKQLNDDIEQFLTPWTYESGKDIEFGGRIEKSVVLNFVEERPYVDFVTCFTMNHFLRDENNLIVRKSYNIEEAIASTARSILVSYKEEDTGIRHIIQSPANCNCND